MGLFDKFKKKAQQEESNDLIGLTEPIVDLPEISAEDFRVSCKFGGIVYDDLPENCLEFDLENRCFRDAEFPDKIYPISSIKDYYIIVGTENGQSVYDFDEIQNAKDVISVFVAFHTPEGMSPAPIMAVFFDKYMAEDPIGGVSKAIEEAEQFIEFLESQGIQKDEW